MDEAIIQRMDVKQKHYVVHSDSQSAIHLSKNFSFNSKSKHTDVRYHWIRGVLDLKLLKFEKICIDKNGANIVDKGLAKGETSVFSGKWPAWIILVMVITF